jgi:hypothetical protein
MTIKRRFPLVSGLLGWLLAWGMILCPLVGKMVGQAQDILITGGTNPYIIIGRGIAWGGSGSGNLNNNYIFHPVTPDEGFCLFLSNNNPTNSHTVTVAVSQTGDPAVNSFQGLAQKWNGVPTTSAFPVTVPILGIVGINYKTTASAGIAVQLSGSVVAGGSPDTVDVFAVQTTASSCGALATNAVQGPYQQNAALTLSQQFPVLIGGLAIPGSTTSAQGFVVGSQGNGFLLDSRLSSQLFSANFKNPTTFAAAQGVSGAGQQEEIILGVVPVSGFGVKTGSPAVLTGFVKTNVLEAVTDQSIGTGGSMPAWIEFQKVTNPGTGAFILGDYLTTAAAINAAWKWVTVSCSVACEFRIANISSAGTTCTAVTPHSMQLYAGGILAFNAQHVSIGGSTACAAQPTTAGADLYDISLAAGTSYTLDVGGLVNFHQAVTIAGLGIFNVTSFTGTMTASIAVMEE